MAIDKSQALIKVITKIPMFNRVGDANATLILKACEFRTGEPGELVCTVNEPSDDFSILLSGSLGVFDRSNIQIAAIAPVAPVGEMGMFTGQPRSATVRVMEKSTLLVVKKVAFERLTRQSPQINRQVYGNVLLTLDRRLKESRSQQSGADRELQQLEDEIEAVKADTAALQDN